MWRRNLAFVLVALLVSGCTGAGAFAPPISDILPLGASYVYPFRTGLAPARLYWAKLTTQPGSSLATYNVTPLCPADFNLASDLKALTSSKTTGYGNLTITDGIQVLAGVSGIPVSTLLTASGGVGYSQRTTLTFTDTQLIQVDQDDAPTIIANYLKTKGKACLAIVQAHLKKKTPDSIIVTTGVVATSQAVSGPVASLGTASCGSSGSSSNSTANTTSTNSSGSKSGTGAPLSGCVGLKVGNTFSVNVQAQGGSVVTQTVPGGIIAIMPAKLPL